MSTNTNKPTIRFVEYKDAFLLKDPGHKIYVPTRYMDIALKQEGYLNFYDDIGTDLVYFFETYLIDRSVTRRVVRKRPRIYVLAKRKKEI